jgi:hypothetical protein
MQQITREQLLSEAYKQGGYESRVSVICFMDGEHFAYLGADPETQNLIPAFGNDWYRFSRPCWK